MNSTQNPMALSEELVPETATCIDIHYAYMEQALISQREVGNVPAVFLHHSVDWISEIVQTWWELMVESCCVRNNLTRTNWSRTRPTVEATDVDGLFEYLKGDWIFIQPELISEHRPLTDIEQQAIGAMDAALDFYESQCWPNSRHFADPNDERFASLGPMLDEQ